jgi:hypothetical protein
MDSWVSDDSIATYVTQKMKDWKHGGCSPAMEVALSSWPYMLSLARKVKKSAESMEKTGGMKFARIDKENKNNTGKLKEHFDRILETAETFVNIWVETNKDETNEKTPRWKCIETGFLYSEPGAHASAWHLESWEQYAMVYTLLSAPSNTGSVETFQQLYEDVSLLPWEPPAEVEKAMWNLKTPPIWPRRRDKKNKGLSSRKSSGKGWSRLMFSNAIHRFPKVPFGEASLYNPKVSANSDWIVMYHVIGKEAYDTNCPVFQKQWTDVRGVGPHLQLNIPNTDSRSEYIVAAEEKDNASFGEEDSGMDTP